MQELLEFLSLSDPNVRFVVVGMVLLGVSSGIVGCFTLLRKRALLGDAIAHSVLPGVCLAFVVFQSKNPAVLLFGAFLTGWLSLIVIDWITNHSRIKADAAIGLTLSVFFGIGILLLTAIQKSGTASQAGLDKFLFGKAASMIGSDVWVFGILSVLLISVIFLFFKEFTLLSFDPDFAQVVGLPVRTLEILLATITVLAVALGIQAVGVVLMASMLIAPAAAARYWTDRLGIMVFLAAIFGGLAGIVGAYISYLSPSMPTGPWVIVVLSVITFLSIIFAPKRGMIARYFLSKMDHKQMLEESILKLFLENNNLATTTLEQERSLPYLENQPLFLDKEELKKGLEMLTNNGLLQQMKTDVWQLTAKGRDRITIF